MKVLDPGQSILVFVTICVDETTANRLHSNRLSDNVTFKLFDGTNECVQVLAELDRRDVSTRIETDCKKKGRRKSRLVQVIKKILN